VGEKWRSESRQGNRERYVDLLTSVFRDSARLLTPDATVYVRTDRREFTRQTTSDALHAAFPDHHMQTVESPYTRHTQTALFGDKEMKPGEVDLVLTKSSNSAQPHADGASAAAV
jgi:tRNA G46 methylase TrmB